MLLTLLIAAPALAQSPPLPEMEVSLAWNGYLRTPGWTEIQVTVFNEAREWNGRLKIVDMQNKLTYSYPLNLPARSYKQYRIPLFISNVSLINLILESAENHQTARKLSTRTPGSGPACAIATAASSTLRSEELNCDTRILLSSQLNELPETPMAWDTLDIFIINGIDTSKLSSGQQEALLNWVSAGGHLIVGGGATFAQAISGLPAPLQSAQPGNTFITDTPPLPILSSHRWAITPLKPKATATSLLSISEAVVAVQQTIGMGQVHLIGWDLNQAEALTWLQSLWENDFIPAVTFLQTNQTPSEVSFPDNHKLMQIPASMLPKFWHLLILFPVYLFLMGPGTWLLVRHLQRPLLAWVLLPLWIILAAVLLALQLSGTFSRVFPLVHEIAIVSVPNPDLPARAVQSTAVFAPQIRTLRWETSGAVRPLWGKYTTDSWYGDIRPFEASVTHTPDNNAQVQVQKPVGILTWATEGIIDPPAITSTLVFSGAQDKFSIQGTLLSEVTLHDVTLSFNDESSHISIGEIITGVEPVAVSEPITAVINSEGLYAGSNVCSRINTRWGHSELSIMQAIAPSISNVSGQGLCYLSGLAQDVPFSSRKLGETHIAETCLIYVVDCPDQPRGAVRITTGSLVAQADDGWIDDNANIHISLASTTVDYSLPTFLHISEVQSLTLTLQPASWEDSQTNTLPPLKIALWEWEESKWVTQALTQHHPEITLPKAAAQQFVDPALGLRLRLTPTSELLSPVRIFVTLDGTW